MNKAYLEITMEVPAKDRGKADASQTLTIFGWPPARDGQQKG